MSESTATTAATLPAASEPTARERMPLRLFFLVWPVLLLSLLIQWPGDRVADWQLYSFYDPGTTLKGDMLLSKGYVPSVDFGYTHGLLSLIYGRAGFALLGRTWWAFIALTALAEIGMAWGLARIFWATGLAKTKAGLLFALVSLPLAVMPAYLTLTHPLEAMLILLALAEQIEGKKNRALALLTICLFVKPSMAYVYGLVLLVLIIREHGENLEAIVRELLPAGAAFVLLFTGLSLCFSGNAVINTLFPATGARTYASTPGFGFFSATTRSEFWWPDDKSKLLLSPAGVYLFGLAALVLGAIVSWAILISRKAAPQRQRRAELLLTLGILHTAFLLAFYGFHGAWAYYSYMPVLALGLFVLIVWPSGGKPAMWAFIGLTLLLGLSHTRILEASFGNFYGKTASPAPLAADGPGAAPGLWRFSGQYAAWVDLLKAIGHQPTVIMTNGYLEHLPPNIEMPDAWFPEPGIPTPPEIQRVLTQVDHAQYVVLFGHLQKEGVELWYAREFADRREQFEIARTFCWPNQSDNVIFTLLKRKT